MAEDTLLGSIQNCTLLYYTEGEKEYVRTHGFHKTKKSPDDLLFLLFIIIPWGHRRGVVNGSEVMQL